MKKKHIWAALAALAALYATKMTLKMAQDVKRYNHILSLSNEGTAQEEFPELMLQVLKQQKQTIKEWKNFMKSAPKDLLRYMKIESM
jgi:hypothetical protein